jgi:hypothetical protein
LLGDDYKPLTNVITVAKNKGDFSDPATAINSINPSATNRYLVVIAPGVYDLASPLILKPYVDVVGSGRNSTILRGSHRHNNSGPAAGLVQTSSHSSLKSLTIENNNTSSGYTYALYNSNLNYDGYITISEIEVNMTGGSRQTGIYNYGNVDLSNISIYISEGSNDQFGIYNNSNNGKIFNARVDISGGTARSYGIYNSGGRPWISNSSISVTDATSFQYGVYLKGGAKVKLDTAKVTTSGTGQSNYAIHIAASSSKIKIHNSELSSPYYSVSFSVGSNATIGPNYISNTILSGGVIGSPACSGVYMEDGTALNAICN